MSITAATQPGECAKCKWWINVRAGVLGECRGRAPIFADNIEDPRVWAYTKRNDWCGDHAPKEPAQ